MRHHPAGAILLAALDYLDGCAIFAAMPKRVHIALACLVILVAGFLFWVGLREREPSCNGKALSVWLTPPTYSGSLNYEDWQAQKHEADQAIRQIGGNGVPVLVRMLRARDSALEVRLRNLAQHIMRIRYTPAYERNQRARHGFEVLGAQAQSAVPALIDIANRDVSRTAKFNALDALGFIGPPAEKAVPSLLQWATNTDQELRCSAIFALGRIRSDPERVVPALTNALRDTFPSVRVHAVIALEQFGPDAKQAVPALVEFFKTDSTTRSASALRAIDPEAATKVSVR